MRVAMAQILVEGGEPERNLARARAAVAAAKARGADAVVLPECFDLGWLDASAHRSAQPVPGPVTQALADAARAHAIAVVAGITERDGARVYNAAVVIGPDGSIQRRHRKICELDFAQELYATGDEVGVAEVAGARIGLAICADLGAASTSIGLALGHMRAQIILSPTAWAVPPTHDQVAEPYGAMWRESYGAIARRFGIAVIGVSNVGTIGHGAWKGWKAIGCSLAIGPDGAVLAQGPYGEDAEALLTVDVPLPAHERSG